MRTLIFLILLTLSVIGRGQRGDFRIYELSIDSVGYLHWLVKNEPQGAKYDIQQYRYGRWINAGKVAGKNQPDYKYKFYPRSGANIIRIFSSNVTSDTITYVTKSSRTGGWLWRVEKKIELASEEYYEIYNSSAKLILKGTAKVVDVKNLENGVYYFYGEKTIQKFLKH
ncbi:MAG: hypothetical protein MRY83_15405 [Flavobacteriales bacterium]|nr:hypothetical protein [Flavobacteriales bacterium]